MVKCNTDWRIQWQDQLLISLSPCKWIIKSLNKKKILKVFDIPPHETLLWPKTYHGEQLFHTIYMLFDGHPRLFMHNVSYSLSMLLIVLIQFNYIYKVLFLIWKVQCTIFQKYLKKRVLIFILHYLSLSLKYYEKHFINFIYRCIDLFDVCMIHKQCNLMFLHLSIRNQKYSFNW